MRKTPSGAHYRNKRKEKDDLYQKEFGNNSVERYLKKPRAEIDESDTASAAQTIPAPVPNDDSLANLPTVANAALSVHVETGNLSTVNVTEPIVEAEHFPLTVSQLTQDDGVPPVVPCELLPTVSVNENLTAAISLDDSPTTLPTVPTAEQQTSLEQVQLTQYDGVPPVVPCELLPTVSENENSTVLCENFVINHDFSLLPSDTLLERFLITDQIRMKVAGMETSTFQHATGPFQTLNGRSINSSWFLKSVGESGKTMLRTWLMYSPIKNSLFCLPCVLFSKSVYQSSLEKPCGFQTFQQRQRMEHHENSENHRICFLEWKELEFRIKNNISVIERQIQTQILLEMNRWREILTRIITCIKYLATHNLALRGHREKLTSENDEDENTGNFLGLIQLVAKYDDVMKKHLKYVLEHPGAVSYLSPLIQNEIIQAMVNVIRQRIISKIKKEKYFGLLLDSTPDQARHEQMSLVVRYVEKKNDDIVIKESFLSFFLLAKKDAQSICDSSLTELNSHELNFMDCRCFCSDNANVMAGNINGLQAIYKRINELSLYMNCNNHSLNLVGVHAVSEESIMGCFFGVMDSLFNFFSRSTLRWDRLKATIGITLKSETETRWSSRKEAVNVVYTNIKEIINLLNDMSLDITENRMTQADAMSLHERLMTYDFLFLSKFWNDVLNKVDLVQKRLQNPKILFIDAALDIKSLHVHFCNEREQIVIDCLDAGKTLCADLRVPVEKRRRHGSLTAIMEMERVMKSSIDKLNHEMENRFKRLHDLDEKFGFFLDVQKLCYGKDDILNVTEKCNTFGGIYKTDVNATELISEIIDIRILLLSRPDAIKHPLDLLKFIHKYNDESFMPNLKTVLCILCIIPSSIASCERSFSKLKLILNYLRATMDPIRLSNLAFLSIEKHEMEETDYTKMIDEFAAMKCRRKNF